MTDQTINALEHNLPSYINTPLFLYQDNRLGKAATLIASFFYSLFTAGKSITASTEYLCALAVIKKRQLYVILNQLEQYEYIKRIGNTNTMRIHWVYTPQSIITIIEKQTSALKCTSDQNLSTSAFECSKLVHSSAVNLCTPVHTYNKDDIKDINITTTSSTTSFENYKEQEKQNLEVVNEQFNRKQKEDEFKEKALNDEKCKQVYEQRFKGLDITLEELYQECVDFWSQSNQMVFTSRFLTHLKKAPIEKYTALSTEKSNSIPKNETHEERMKRYALERENQKKRING